LKAFRPNGSDRDIPPVTVVLIRARTLPTTRLAGYSIVALAGTEIVLQNCFTHRAATGISPADVFGG